MCGLEDRLCGRLLMLRRVVPVAWWRRALDRWAAGMGVARSRHTIGHCGGRDA